MIEIWCLLTPPPYAWCQSRRREDGDHSAVDLQVGDGRRPDVFTSFVLDRHDRDVPTVGEVVGQEVVALLRRTGPQQ